MAFQSPVLSKLAQEAFNTAQLSKVFQRQKKLVKKHPVVKAALKVVQTFVSKNHPDLLISRARLKESLLKSVCTIAYCLCTTLNRSLLFIAQKYEL